MICSDLPGQGGGLGREEKGSSEDRPQKAVSFVFSVSILEHLEFNAVEFSIKGWAFKHMTHISFITMLLLRLQH